MNDTEYEALTIGDWIITFILLAIPFVNIIMLIVWAASGSTHPSKKSYAQAALILGGIAFVLAILAAVMLPALASSMR